MDMQGRVAIVTGGANGIGKALCRSLHAAGARGLVIADLDADNAAALAAEVHGHSLRCDVSREADIQAVVDLARREYGRIDLFVSNAGITVKGGAEVGDRDWQRLWEVNVMSHVYAARAVLPDMLQRGEGYLVQVSSAAGLLTEIGSAPYSVTKHAVVAFAEWLSIHHQKQGIRVSCVCPAGVATDFLDLSDPVHQFLHVSSQTPEQVAECILRGIRDEKFLILPHEEVREFFAFKGEDYDRWLRNFARVHEKLQRKTQRAEAKKAG